MYEVWYWLTLYSESTGILRVCAIFQCVKLDVSYDLVLVTVPRLSFELTYVKGIALQSNALLVEPQSCTI